MSGQSESDPLPHHSTEILLLRAAKINTSSAVLHLGLRFLVNWANTCQYRYYQSIHNEQRWNQVIPRFRSFQRTPSFPMANTFAHLTFVFSLVATTKRWTQLLHIILKPRHIRSSFASFNTWLAQLEGQLNFRPLWLVCARLDGTSIGNSEFIQREELRNILIQMWQSSFLNQED